ncbi:hypothetical protein BC832DRAFT_6884 [Gaertneriomyces semiglobifer]|nr:hypothetical protein BC832DRAFT_6884 [Gaertneriomyces semiglobifer]
MREGTATNQRLGGRSWPACTIATLWAICIFFTQPGLVVGQTQNGPLAYFKSSKLGFGTMPFQSITSMGLQNNALMCHGPANPSEVTGTTNVRYDQVWWMATNTSGSFIWGYSSPGDDSVRYNALSVKHRSLQTKQNLLFLSEPGASTINVHSYWYLSPRQTPDIDRPVRSVAYPNGTSEVSVLTSLDAHGGLFGAEGTKVWWIPVVKPLTADPPEEDKGNATLVADLLGTVQAMWLMQNSQTLFVAEWFNTSNNIHRFSVRSGSPIEPMANISVPLVHINNTVYPHPPTNTPVVSSIVVNPVSSDIYVGLYGAGGVLIYNTQGYLKGQVTTTFVNVLALEMDDAGSSLYIAGDDGAGSGRLDFLDLASTGLRDRGVDALANADGRNIKHGFLGIAVVFLVTLWLRA